ncbi:MAG TPA: sensor histidine kinase [Bacteroidales bacterium]|nr:sensor histidine kinase [Bacteroidales bacterium]
MFAIQRIRGSLKQFYFYAVYWAAYLVFFSFQRMFAVLTMMEKAGPKEGMNELKIAFFVNLIYLPLVIFASHFVVNYLLPRHYFNKRFTVFAGLTAATIILYPLLAWIVRTVVIDPIFTPPEKYNLSNYFSAMLIFVFGMAPLAWFEIAKHLREEDKIRQKIDKDRLEAHLKLKETELKLLKSQIQPHFLFNTLNNLYTLALEKSDRTPELIIRLSDMLSYIIYDCKSEKVPVSKEIDFIRNYLELQKVRYETCRIDFTCSCDNGNKKIAPMILHCFIDNSFKHGAERDPGNPWIKINIMTENGTLNLSVVNSTPGNGNRISNPGIGISNTIKRLDLLYSNRYDLQMQNSDEDFSVNLKILL